MTIYWKQCSKVQWNVLGDNMTKFFFKHAKERATHSHIRGCKIENGRWITDQDELAKHAVQYFQNLFYFL